jgi:hypothetical protein
VSAYGAIDGKPVVRLHAPDGGAGQRTKAAVNPRWADVVAATLQFALHVTDLGAGLGAHPSALREHLRGTRACGMRRCRCRDQHGSDNERREPCD